MSADYDTNRLSALLPKLLHGAADPAELAELQSLLASHAEARQQYRELLEIEAGLHDWASQQAPLVQEPAAATEPVTVARAAEPRKLTRQALLGLAAAALVAISSATWLLLPRATAADVLREIHTAALQLIDCTYDLRRVTRTAATEQTITGRLYLRGDEDYVVTLPHMALGRRGADYWFVPTDGAVLLSHDFSWVNVAQYPEINELGMLEWLPRPTAEITLDSISSILTLMKQSYHLELQRGASLAGIPNRCDLLIARRSQPDPQLPRVIRVWADDTSRRVYRFECDWEPGGRSNGPDLMVANLVSTAPLADAWYEHQSHHDSGRPVVVVPPLRANRAQPKTEAAESPPNP